MNISICTLFPDLYRPFLCSSLIGRAQEQGLVSVDVCNLFSYVAPKQRIDSPTFGHQSGMLIKPEVVDRAISSISSVPGASCNIFFSPKGERLNQRLVQRIYDTMMTRESCIMLPARYEGMDARVEEEYADFTVSVGDFVLMGGDLPAMMLTESLLRLVPGVVGKKESVERDSFFGALLDYPEYTHPVVWHGKEVPAVLRSGNHAAIEAYRTEQALNETVLKRFDWFSSHAGARAYGKQALRTIPPHYVALYHTNVCVGPERVSSTTSVTSLDIHDIARSAKTYGMQGYYMVSSLKDQQSIVSTLLSFWNEGSGGEYNPSRQKALATTYLKESHQSVIEDIERKHGVPPLVIGTSAQDVGGERSITYHDQARVWQQHRPVLLALGTGQGLDEQFLENCDYILQPVNGMSDYNHLSVRSAAAVIFDRWLGLNTFK